jgi:transposase
MGAYPKFTPEEFTKYYMEVYRKGGTCVNLAAKLGISVQATRQLTHRYRRKGIKLPKLERQTTNVLSERRIKGLNDIIAKDLNQHHRELSRP